MLPPTPSRPSPAPLVRAPFPLEASFGPLTRTRLPVRRILLLDKNPNPSERQPPSRREQRRYQLTAGIMPEGYAPLAKVARVCDILDDETSALDHLWASTAQHGQGVSSIPVFGGHRVRHRSRVRHLAG